jgi:tetratricopeptide (TPR) repeat protein
MIQRRLAISVGFALFLLGGCKAMPTQPMGGGFFGSGQRAFISDRERRAHNYESEGALRLALNEWLVISAVSPDAPDVTSQIARLEEAIASRAQAHKKQAQKALARGDLVAAQLSMLKALALQPTDRDAKHRLKDLERLRARARIESAPKIATSRKANGYSTVRLDSSTRRAEKGVGGAAPKEGARVEEKTGKQRPGTTIEKDGNFRLALRLLSNKEYEAALKHFILASQAAEAPEAALQKHIAETRNALAEQFYDSGVGAFRRGFYDEAASLFLKALEFNPDNQKARLYLSSAQELQARKIPD